MEHLGRLEEAVEAREQALLADSGDVDSRYYLTLDLCDTGRFEEALQVAAPLFNDFTDDPDILRLHGACLSYNNRHEDALAKWAELERIEGVTPNLLHNRASTLDALGNGDEALVTINQAIQEDGGTTAVHFYTRGMIHEHLGNDYAAIEDYLHTLELDPEYVEAAVNLVEVTASTELVDEVDQRLTALLEDTPSSAKLLYVRGQLMIERAEYREALNLMQEAIRREPGLGIAWYTLAMLHNVLGDAEATISTSDRALQYFTDAPELWMQRAHALERLSRYSEAIDCYDRLTQIIPQEAMPWLQLGRLFLLELNRPADARGVLREALLLQPANDTIQWLLALAYLRLGQPHEAAHQLQNLLQAEPTHVWGLLVRAALNAQNGNIDAAFDDLEIAAKQGCDTRLLLREPLFEPLWSDPRFSAKATGRAGTKKSAR
jgi:tetratricopeptide (TPR) repeat protein